MRVGIDCTATGRPTTGVESYTLNLTCALLQLETPVEFTLFLPRPVPEPLRALRHRFHSVKSPFGTRLVPNQLWVAAAIRSSALDLVHYPAFAPVLPGDVFVMTVHDAAAWKFGWTLSKKGSLYWRTLIALAAKRCRRIITPSASSRDEIIMRFACPPEKVAVIHHGVRAELLAHAATGASPILQALRLREGFALFVGTVEPRKNLGLIVRALSELRAQGITCRLVVAGRKAWGTAALQRAIEDTEMKDIVIFTGHIEDEDLATLYRSATFLVQPSWHEGFSLPVLEAMALGCPVLASRIPTHTEIVGDAGWFFAPDDVHEVSTLMRRLLRDDRARALLAGKGSTRAQRFSWVTAAQRTLQVYQGVLNQLTYREASAWTHESR